MLPTHTQTVISTTHKMFFKVNGTPIRPYAMQVPKKPTKIASRSASTLQDMFLKALLSAYVRSEDAAAPIVSIKINNSIVIICTPFFWIRNICSFVF